MTFDKKFQDVIKKALPRRVEIGMGRAMLNLLNDCVNEVPTVPLDEGTLRGSGSIFVQDRLIGTSEHLPSAKAGAATLNSGKTIKMGSYVGFIGFNVPYAAKVHEGIDMHFKEPSSGAKFLESKLISKKNTYLRVIANTIKGGGNA